jgi:hypothetical protein
MIMILIFKEHVVVRGSIDIIIFSFFIMPNLFRFEGGAI